MAQARSSVALLVATLALAACGAPLQPVRATHRPPPFTWAPSHARDAELSTALPRVGSARCRLDARTAPRPNDLGELQLADFIERHRARGRTCAVDEYMRSYVQRFPVSPRARQYERVIEHLEWR